MMRGPGVSSKMGVGLVRPAPPCPSAPTTLAALALTLSLAGVDASAGEAVKFLRQGSLYCPASESGTVEQLVDEPDAGRRVAIAQAAVVKGRCVGRSAQAQAVAQVRSARSPAGHAYVCFHTLDAVDRSDTGAHCAMEPALTTVADEIERRRGDFVIAVATEARVKARCEEGGTVVLAASAGRWERLAQVFPVTPTPAARPVTGDRDAALREGCRGLDYRPGATPSER